MTNCLSKNQCKSHLFMVLKGFKVSFLKLDWKLWKCDHFSKGKQKNLFVFDEVCLNLLGWVLYSSPTSVVSIFMTEDFFFQSISVVKL